jgi:hypothetical protein
VPPAGERALTDRRTVLKVAAGASATAVAPRALSGAVLANNTLHSRRLQDDRPIIAMEVCTAGNLRTTLLFAKLPSEKHQLERLLIATDTPTSSGVMPLGMLYTISHIVDDATDHTRNEA